MRAICSIGTLAIAIQVAVAMCASLGESMVRGTAATPNDRTAAYRRCRVEGKDKPRKQTVLRIEIDCSLMPCDGTRGNGCCLYQVPKQIKKPGYDNKRTAGRRYRRLAGFSASCCLSMMLSFSALVRRGSWSFSSDARQALRSRSRVPSSSRGSSFDNALCN